VERVGVLEAVERDGVLESVDRDGVLESVDRDGWLVASWLTRNALASKGKTKSMDIMIIHLKLVTLVKNRIIEMPPFVGLAARNGHSFGSVTRSGSVTCGRESNKKTLFLFR